MRGGTAFLPIFARFPSPRAPPRSIVQRLSARRASARRAHMQNQHEPAALPAFSRPHPHRRRNPLRHRHHRRTSPRHTRTRRRTRRRHYHPTNHRRPTNSRRPRGASCHHRPPCSTRRARSPPSPRCTGRARIPCPHDLSFPVVPRSEARPTRWATGRARARVTRGGGPSWPPLARRVRAGWVLPGAPSPRCPPCSPDIPVAP